MSLSIYQFLCLSDNFGVLIHDPETKATAAIDAPDAAPILNALSNRGWQLTDILITHHHADHTQGIGGLKAAFPDVRVTGPAQEADKIFGLDVKAQEGDRIKIGSVEAKVIEVPGHTSGHVAYWIESEKLLFSGDTLFAMGCGRGFEEPGPVLYKSLMKLAALPEDTKVYCGHEYTFNNARFALSVDPQNTVLRDRSNVVAMMREAGQFTLPTTISLERATNPFLRASDIAIQSTLGMAGADPAAIFTELRERKNHF
jgi:hydroxyacylglutathione hydrolase